MRRRTVVVLTMKIEIVLSGFGFLSLIVGCSSAAKVPGTSEMPRPDLVAKVASGELATARASWWGYNPTNSTAALRGALSSPASHVIIDRMPGPWVTLPLTVGSDKTVVFEPGVEVVAMRGAFKDKNDVLLKIANAKNVRIGSKGATLRMWRCDYTNAALYATAEWRHAISVYKSENVQIRGLTLAESGGDGIYICEAKDLRIRDVVCDGNNRQGISVISAENLLIVDTVMRNTKGAPPESGIDFEPNAPQEKLCNIVLRNCTAENNAGSGFEFATWILDDKSPRVSITLENCRSVGNRKGTHIEPVGNILRGFHGEYVLRNCVFEDEADRSPEKFQPRGPLRSTCAARFIDCTLVDPKLPGGRMKFNGGWEEMPVPKKPDGSPLEVIHLTPERLASAQPCDLKPGETVPVNTLQIRYRARYVFYAAVAGKVHFAGSLVTLGKYPIAKDKLLTVKSLDGKVVGTVPAPTQPGKRTNLDFVVDKPGFYELYVEVGPHKFAFEETSVPIAVVANEGVRAPAFSSSEGSVYIRIAERSSTFAVFATGGGGAEKVSAVLHSPSGKKMWEVDDVSEQEIWLSTASPEPGLWKLTARRPKKGCLDDFSFELTDTPMCLFLTKEKTWK